MTAEPRRAGVLLLAFGGPATLDDVEPFMERLMGRAPSPEVVDRVKARYTAVGGGSPLPRIVGELAAALGESLGEAADVRVGMRYSEPFLGDAIAEMAAAGLDPVVALSLSPHYSAVSTGAYKDAVLAAADAAGYRGTLDFPESWHEHEGFVEAIADRLRAARDELGARAAGWPVVFTAHSLPASDLGIERYVTEVGETVAAVLARTGLEYARIAYQSRGTSPGDWLEPDVGDVIDEIAAQGASGVFVVPIGFVTEHMETLYDLDVVAAKRAGDAAIAFARVATVGTHPAFVAALAEVARRHIEEEGVPAGGDEVQEGTS